MHRDSYITGRLWRTWFFFYFSPNLTDNVIKFYLFQSMHQFNIFNYQVTCCQDQFKVFTFCEYKQALGANSPQVFILPFVSRRWCWLCAMHWWKYSIGSTLGRKTWMGRVDVILYKTQGFPEFRLQTFL